MLPFSTKIESDTQKFLGYFSGSRFTELNQFYLKQLDDVGHPYPPSQAIPFFAPLKLQNVLTSIGRAIFNRLESDVGEFWESEKTASRWPIPRHLQPAIRHKFDSLTHHPVMRIDLFLDPLSEKIHLLEINAADPSAFAWNDIMLEGLLDNAQFSQFIVDEHAIVEKMVAKHLAMVLQRYSKHCDAHHLDKKKSPTIALTIDRASTVYFDFVALERLYKRHGATVFLIVPDSFKWNRKTDEISVNNQIVDIIIRDTLDEIYFPNGDQVSGDLPAILRESNICVVNPTTATLGDQKAWLAILWQALQNETNDIDEGTRLLKDALPETHLLNSHNLDYFLRDKGRWVLKPSFGYGGHGIVIGISTSDNDWKSSLEIALTENIPSILQWRCPPGCGFLLQNKPDSVQMPGLSMRHAVFSFWLFEGEFVGSFARLSKDPIINTHQGGALVPVVWLP